MKDRFIISGRVWLSPVKECGRIIPSDKDIGVTAPKRQTQLLPSSDIDKIGFQHIQQKFTNRSIGHLKRILQTQVGVTLAAPRQGRVSHATLRCTRSANLEYFFNFVSDFQALSFGWFGNKKKRKEIQKLKPSTIIGFCLFRILKLNPYH